MAYFGISAGAAFPLKNTSDVNSVGPHITATIGANAPSGILGLRLDGTFSTLYGKNLGRAGFSSGEGQFPELTVITGGLNGVIRAPFGILASSGFYIFGGGGVAHVRSFVQERDDNRGQPGPFDIERNRTRGMLNGGAGIDIGRRDKGALFLEGRFMQIYTKGQKINLVPVTLGVKF
jgi:hypothetical protein